MKVTKLFTVFTLIVLSMILTVPVFAQETAEKFDVNAKGMKLIMSTGGTGGVYYGKAAPEIQSQLGKSLEVEILESSGSVDNILKMKRGDVNSAIVQMDALIAEGYEAQVVGGLYSEYVHVITRRKDKSRGWKKVYESIKDLDPKSSTVAIGPKNSGSDATWRAMCAEDDRYAKFATKPLSGAAALAALESMQVDAVIFVSGKGGKDIKRANAKKAFRITAFDDWDFDDVKHNGRKIYHFVKLEQDKAAYSDMFPGWYNDVDTIAIEAVVIVSSEWYANNENMFGVLYDAVTDASKVLKKNMGQK